MSIEQQAFATGGKCRSSTGSVTRIIQPREKDLGGFSVRRILPHREQRMVGPWIFFDHMGPAEFEAGHGIDVRPHPHINLATVTYLFEGEILHRDSLGNTQPIRPGAINLMVAGRGIVHSERERAEVRNTLHRLDGLQLWLALPESDEETEPGFHHHDAAQIPEVTGDGVEIRVMMGEAFGLRSPVKTFAETLYLEASMQAGQQLTLPRSEELAFYVAEGEVNVDNTTVTKGCMAVLSTDAVASLTACHNSRLAVIGGQHLGHRHIEWNFVSSRPERIEQAKADWQAGRFPTVPGDEEEFIPLPD